MLARPARRASFGLVVCALAACGTSDEAWTQVQGRWLGREPGAWAAWSELADRGHGEARRRLDAADELYRRGIAQLERGEPSATDALRRGAEIAPIDPRLYLPLARACRAQGAILRAIDFYGKYMAEAAPGPSRVEAERELSQIAQPISDPFSPPASTVRTPWATAASIAAAAVLLAFVTSRRRRTRIGVLLQAHPERAAAFVYRAGVLRHELLKHRLAPLRDGTPTPARPLDPVNASWQRHTDALAAALGVSRRALLHDPILQAADRAMRALARAEALGRIAPSSARAALVSLDEALLRWTQLLERTVLDDRLLERLIESLRDERPGRRLPVAVEHDATSANLVAVVFSNDLLLVLRNLVRNAISASEAIGGATVRLERRSYIDETGQEWARIVVHDPSAARPPADGPTDRGLGLVRSTLDRYGGALLEVEPAPGYAKALAVSLPCADGEGPALSERTRIAA